jgi:hypothetical protein
VSWSTHQELLRWPVFTKDRWIYTTSGDVNPKPKATRVTRMNEDANMTGPVMIVPPRHLGFSSDANATGPVAVVAPCTSGIKN